MPRFFKVFGPYQGRWFDLTVVLDSRQFTLGLTYGKVFVDIYFLFLAITIEW